MASNDVWADFETLRHNVKQNTVDKLKHIVVNLNEECRANLTKSGKKQELIDKIINKLDIWKRTNDIDTWVKAKTILNSARQDSYPARRTPSYPATATFNTYQAPNPAGSNIVFQPPTVASTSSLPRYDPYAPPRRPPVPATPAAAAGSPSIRFKTSPFFRVERAISNVVECPESSSQMDRKSQTLTFIMNNDLLQKLQSPSPKYQLRLYCTSSTYYTPTPAFRPNLACPIEFPPTCEVRVNGVQLQANLKGMKKKPGTAPPPDVGKSVRTSLGAQNRVEMVYVNSSQQPVQTKQKYYMVAMLVEVTTVDQLIDRLRKGKYKSNTEILAKMRRQVDEEDEIVAGHQKMSLKCPLSYMRITTPCRSWQCVHPQCFDAYSWFSVMEQTTTWMCPVCEKVLNVEDLIIDGYFDEILKATPEEVEDVIVEPDGEWHTSDGVYGSSAWKAAHAKAKASSTVGTVKKRSPSPTKPSIKQEDGGKPSGPLNAEIVILDSDDEDEGRVKRELSPSYDSTQKSGRTTAQSSLASLPAPSQASDVIDLTLDSDDEEPPPRAPAPSKKRCSDERDIQSPTEPIWKKSRTDNVPSSSGVGLHLPQGYTPPSSARPLPSSPTSLSSSGRYHASYPIPSYPYSPPYESPTAPVGPAHLPPRPVTNGLNGRFPDAGNQYLSRPNGSSASSSSSAWR
ncbi:unnamed protein product [Somion occarium]|uniref:Uncharacterized protein n=1 Tax=Somion occarium TaxID=3059160 RepID=A0ABP1CLX9_9APHY